MSQFKDITGKTYGRLTVVNFHGRNKFNKLLWLCECLCGNSCIVSGNCLQREYTKSCGCITHTVKDGIKGTVEYYLYLGAKRRSESHNMAFSITIKDIIIPEHCPILGIKISKGNGVIHAGSPSIDRINPSGGYTPDNICVISHRANSMKSNLTAETLQKLIQYVKNHKSAYA